MIKQFKSAIQSALASKDEVRALMRARSGMQRFPVVQWVEDLDTLQSRSIRVHEKQASGSASIFHLGSRKSSRGSSLLSSAANTAPNTAPSSRPSTRPQSRVASPVHSPIQSRAPSPIREDENISDDGRSSPPTPVLPRTLMGNNRSFRMRTASPSISSKKSAQDMTSTTRNGSFRDLAAIPRNVSWQDMKAIANAKLPSDSVQEDSQSRQDSITLPPKAHILSRLDIPRAVATPMSTAPSTPTYDELPNEHFSAPYYSTKSKSVLSLQSIVGEQKDFNLQKTDPFFTDTTGVYYHNFDKMLDGVNSRNSTTKFCIEKYLEESEREWFGKRHDAKLGLSTPNSTKSSIYKLPKRLITERSRGAVTESEIVSPSDDLEQFSLGNEFVPAKGLRKFLQRKIGNWQIYSLILALVSPFICSDCGLN